MSLSNIFGGMLAGLGQGFVAEKERVRQETLAQEKQDLNILAALIRSEELAVQVFARRQLQQRLSENLKGTKVPKEFKAITQALVAIDPGQVGGEDRQAPPPVATGQAPDVVASGPPPVSSQRSVSPIQGPTAAVSPAQGLPLPPQPTLGQQVERRMSQLAPPPRFSDDPAVARLERQDFMEQTAGTRGRVESSVLGEEARRRTREEQLRETLRQEKSKKVKGDLIAQSVLAGDISPAAAQRELAIIFGPQIADSQIRLLGFSLPTPTKETDNSRAIRILGIPESELTEEDKRFITGLKRKAALNVEAAASLRLTPVFADDGTVRLTPVTEAVGRSPATATTFRMLGMRAGLENLRVQLDIARDIIESNPKILGSNFLRVMDFALADTGTTGGEILQRQFIRRMSPAELNLLTRLLILRDSVFAVRGMTGMPPARSQAMVNAFWRLIPNAADTTASALQKLSTLRLEVDTLEQFIPRIDTGGMVGGTGTVVVVRVPGESGMFDFAGTAAEAREAGYEVIQ